MTISNYDLASKFSYGGSNGSSSRMSIRGNKLYSYSACIAIREYDNGLPHFIISNRVRFLGGKPRSVTTSRHISLVHSACLARGKIKLVDGWAETNRPEWFVPEYPTHKTVWGLMRSFASHRYGGWTGEWIPETGTQKIEWQHNYTELIAPNGKIVAVRRYIWPKHCNDNCDKCPARFLCKTEGEGYYGYVFFVAEGRYAKKVKKYLHPCAIVEDLTPHLAYDRL